MSTYDDRRHGQGAGRQGPSQGAGRPARERRAPLFPLEADDIAPSARRAPPAPLGELLGDLDDALPMRPLPPRREATPERRPPPPPERPVPAERRAPPPQSVPTRAAAPRPQAQQARAQSQPAPRPVATQVPRPRQELRSASLEELLEQPISALEQARGRFESIDSDLARLQLAEARPRLGAGYVPIAPPAAFGLNSWAVLGVICIASLLVIFTLGGRGGSAGVSGWNPFQRASETVAQQNVLVAAVRAAGDYALKGPPSITPQQIDRILESYNSPAVGSGEDWYNLGLKYGIDPAFAVAFFIHESSAGSNPAWAGIKPDGSTTHNVGNIICAGYATCYGRFRDYPSWAEGIEDWYRLIDVEYIQGRGHQTVADIIPVYAPSFENDVNGYVNAVERLIDSWRSGGVQ